MIYLLTAIGLTSGGNSTVHIYTQTIHRTTQLTTAVGRLGNLADFYFVFFFNSGTSNAVKY